MKEKMSNNSKYKDPRAAESTAMTYGMSDEWDFQDTQTSSPIPSKSCTPA